MNDNLELATSPASEAHSDRLHRLSFASTSPQGRHQYRLPAHAHDSPRHQGPVGCFVMLVVASQVIDNVPAIDIMNPDGLSPEDLGSSVVLQNVHFRYPSRPEVAVLTGLSLTVRAGDTLALVGESGSGKSTVVALLERFYDPEKGAASPLTSDPLTMYPNSPTGRTHQP